MSGPLENVLAETRAALLAGDFAALDLLALRTGEILDAPLSGGPETLRRLQVMAGENAGLIEAAARGIAAARQRLRRQETLTTYDASGRRGTIAAQPSATPRRV
ncbi:hypothetical protein [Pseudogemmobacter humi]|uniref:FlgN protein n=1 Tax=Pseudogemmobacter humi TaxID=2483812 RepID=A0A3P5WZL4_9RHOB|nr:hypothetical protein [Pseudogemmobacter humi]VDC20354.1 hypothetical protein XINFAN_00447 [Pseudogemmobacter humi]